MGHPIRQHVIRTATKPRRYYYRTPAGVWKTTPQISKAERFAYHGACLAYRTIVPAKLSADKLAFQSTRLEIAELPKHDPKVELRQGCKVLFRNATDAHGSSLEAIHLNNPKKRARYCYDHGHYNGVEVYADAAADFLGTSDLLACGFEGGYVFLARKVKGQ